MNLDHAEGAYGFQMRAEHPRARLPGLAPVSADAPVVTLSWRRQPVEEDRLELTERSATVAVRKTVLIEIDRERRHVDIAAPDPLSPEAIVHPISTTALAILARWRGHATLHAGAILHNGVAYALCGRQGAGKSSTLASLARRGHRVVADDLLVIEGGRVYAGPSCIDLRADAAKHFAGAKRLGVIGARERFRLKTEPAPPQVRLGGIFLLGWHDEGGPEATELGLSERASLIHAFDYAGFVGLPKSEVLMDLLALPMWHIARTREWDAIDLVLDRILELASTAGAEPG